MDNVVVVIPSLEPTDILIQFSNELKKEFVNIVVVNDGSSDEYEAIFNQLKTNGIIVLKHAVNQGKGRALKTAFNYVLNEMPFVDGLVTADADGQHLVSDIKKCAQKMIENKHALILGCRDFDEPDVPFRSKFGNKVTRIVYSFFIGIKVTDSMTGLRGLGLDLVRLFMKTDGDRFHYESNMLIDAKFNEVPFIEVPIETVYIENNEGSHFNPLKDSFQIYKTFFKYIFSSIAGYITDISFFVLFMSLLAFVGEQYLVIAATIGARIISSLLNYKINYTLVFKKGENKKAILKYFLLVVVQMFVSAFAVNWLNGVIPFINVVAIKIIVDSIIFVVNYYIQREFIFD